MALRATSPHARSRAPAHQKTAKYMRERDSRKCYANATGLLSLYAVDWHMYCVDWNSP